MKKITTTLFCLLVCSTASAQQPAATSPAPAATPPATTTTPAPTTPAPTAGAVGNRNSVYTDRIPPEQIISLDANGDKFLARHIPDLSGEPRGAAIILHDTAQNPAWPFTAAALSDDLPLHGWDTLSIELPAPDLAAAKLPAATPAATPPANPSPPAATPAAAQPAATAAPTGLEPRVQARIAAALKYYSDQQTKNVVLIGFGSGTIRSAEFLRQYAASNGNKFEPISALVMVMPLNKLAGIESDLPKILPTTSASALDLIFDNDPLAKADAEARRRAVLHQREREYRQLQLPPINASSDPQRSLMVKRVRGWLQKNAGAPTDEEKK